MKSPSIVCDPTVVVDALLRPEGASGLVLRRFLERRDFDLVLTEDLLEHIRLATGDAKVLEGLNLTREEVERWVVALGVLATLVEADPDDAAAGRDPVLSAAAVAGDSIVVSLDPAVLERPASAVFEAVRPEVLLEVLEARDAAGLSSGRAG